MRYRLLQELPRYKVGEILDTDENDQLKLIYCFPKYHPDFFEPIPDEPKRWSPKEGKNVFFLNGFYEICTETYREEHPYCYERYCSGNYFQTRKQAEEAQREHKALNGKLHEKWGE